MKILGLLVSAALAVPASGQDAKIRELDRPAYAPPAADEAHGLKGAERAAALHVLRSHYRNLLEAFGPLRLPGRDLKDLSQPAVCAVPVEIRPEEFRAGSFVEGLPVRRAQPIVFNSFQEQVVGGQSRCFGEIVFTREAQEAAAAKALEVLLENSGTTYCRADSDCYGAEIVADPCGVRRRVRVFGSNTTDAVLFVALRKFMPSLLANMQAEIQGEIAHYQDRHPDWRAPGTPGVCLPRWEETPVASVCAEHSCRAAP